MIVTVARVTRRIWHKNTKTGLWRQTDDRSLYASQINLPATVIGAATVAILAGFFLVLAAGVAHPEALHNAVHDTRHALAFPCH